MKILLVCNAGMSTGIMQLKLQEEAKKRGMEAEINAVPMVEISEYLDGVDVILLGPQIKYASDEIKQKYTQVPVMVITPQDFGMMNAKKVFDEVLKIIN